MQSLQRIARRLADVLAKAKFEDPTEANGALLEFDQHDAVAKAFRAVAELVDEAQAAQLHRHPDHRGKMYEAIRENEQLIKEVLRAYREGNPE